MSDDTDNPVTDEIEAHHIGVLQMLSTEQRTVLAREILAAFVVAFAHERGEPMDRQGVLRALMQEQGDMLIGVEYEADASWLLPLSQNPPYELLIQQTVLEPDDREAEERAEQKGEWRAFDRVLEWLNEQEELSLPKTDVFAQVMAMRPKEPTYAAADDTPG